MLEKIKVLFLCTANSCRSQIAEGAANNLFGGKIKAKSAGTKPSFVNPYAIKIMNKIGIDITSQRSKNVKEFINDDFDYIITLCGGAKAECPFIPGNAKRLHWPIADPADASGSEDEKMAAFRAAREEIKERIEKELL